MEPSNIIEFIPEGDIPTIAKKWEALIVLNVVGVILWALLQHLNKPSGNSIGYWLFLSLLVLAPVDIYIVFFSKDPLKVTINKESGIFKYDHIDFFGREDSTTVYLKNVYYKYRPDFTKTAPPRMRLLMYNNYFKNQVVIKAADKVGFNRAQLDTIVETIKQVQDALKA